MGAVFVLTGTGASSLSKWFIVWLFARYAGGAEALGVYSYLLAIATPIFVAAEMGLRTIFLSSLERWPWSTFVRLRIAGVFTGSLLLLVILWFLPGSHFGLGVSILCLKIFDSLHDIYFARIQYANKMARLGLLMTASGIVTMILALVVVELFGDVIASVLAAALVSLMTAAWAGVEAKRCVYQPTTDDRGTGKILRASVSVTAAQLMATCIFQLPVLTLSVFSDARSVGLYSAAAYLLTAAALIGSSLQTLLLTPARRIRDEEGITSLIRYSDRITLVTISVGVLCGILVIAMGSWVLQSIYGHEFAVQRVPLAVLSVAAVATATAYIQSSILSVMNLYTSLTTAMVCSGFATIAAGGVLIAVNATPLLLGSGMVAVGTACRVVIMYVMVHRARTPRRGSGSGG